MRLQLTGCTPEPLGSYLRGLAVLRLVSEQVDHEARGWWSDDGFELESSLDKVELAGFFLSKYRPTPILAPWNGGSGFYPKDRKVGIEALAGSTDERFSEYRAAIEAARSIPEIATQKGAAKADEDARRAAILRSCRNRLPDAAVEWLDAAIGLSSDGKRAFAPILGTGGNEGRLDYTNNFMESIADLLIAPDRKTPVEKLLRNALFGEATAGFQAAAVGQFDPGKAGGFNQSEGVDGPDVPTNPWNFVLTLEGAVAWASGLYRRQGVAYRSFLCSPFTVQPSAVGYGSVAAKDGQLARAEIWAPLWSRPALYQEIRALLREGRAVVGGKPAQSGIEFAEAACLLGVDRGIDSFVRYNLLKRRGDSYIALPAGRFEVRDRSDADLVRQLDPLLDRLDSRTGSSRPAQYDSLRRQIDEAMFDVLLRGVVSGGVNELRDLAASVGRLQRWLLLTGQDAWMAADLGQEWVERLNKVPEARIAAALAGIYNDDIRGIRSNLDRKHREFAWTGQDLSERLASVLERRLMSTRASESKFSPVKSARAVSTADAMSYLDGDVDDELIEDLLFAFTLVRQDNKTAKVGGAGWEPVWPGYAILKLLFAGAAVPAGREKVTVAADARIPALLRAGNVESAAAVAVRRLQNAGLSPLDGEYGGGLDPRRLAASLLIPMWDVRALCSTVLRTENGKEETE